jgi:hypothetical protein
VSLDVLNAWRRQQANGKIDLGSSAVVGAWRRRFPTARRKQQASGKIDNRSSTLRSPCAALVLF